MNFWTTKLRTFKQIHNIFRFYIINSNLLYFRFHKKASKIWKLMRYRFFFLSLSRWIWSQALIKNCPLIKRRIGKVTMIANFEHALWIFDAISHIESIDIWHFLVVMKSSRENWVRATRLNFERVQRGF